MFLGWYDPDRKRKAAEKLADAVARFREKFGADPDLALVAPETAEALSSADGLGVEVQARSFIPRHTFYVGYVDVPEEVRR